MTPSHPQDQPGPEDIYRARRMAAVSARWDAKAAQWDQALQQPDCHLNEDEAYARFLHQLAAIVRQRQGFCRRHGIIDAGCATGLVLTSVISSFSWGVGVDISPEMIRLAQAKNVPRASFRVGDCFELSALCPLAGAVVSRGVLVSHYGAQQGQELLCSLHACLVKGGFILCDFLNRAGQAKYRHQAEHKTYFDADEICLMGEQAGFRKVTVYGEPERRVRILYGQR